MMGNKELIYDGFTFDGKTYRPELTNRGLCIPFIHPVKVKIAYIVIGWDVLRMIKESFEENNFEFDEDGDEEPNEKKENEWYIDTIKEWIRQAEEKRKEEPKKSSGKYPWEEPRNTHTCSGWVNEVLANSRGMLYSVEEIHPAMDLMLKANIADELHRLNDILGRRKG